MRYYVYALIDPTNENKPFYIGKGMGDRLKSHFKEASSNEQTVEGAYDIEFDISTIAEYEKNEYISSQTESPKIKKLRELIQSGWEYTSIARIIAKNLDEMTALALESFLIKSMYGLDNLTNIIEGEHAERFRPYNNWDCIEGFDISSATRQKVRGSRIEQLQAMLANKIDKPLLQIQKAFPNLHFKSPDILDSGELGIKADVRGTRIKIFTWGKNIQIELRGNKKWLTEHFEKLQAEHVLRNDKVGVFLPRLWKGPKNMTTDVQVAIKRVELMLEIVNNDSREELSKEALMLIS